MTQMKLKKPLQVVSLVLLFVAAVSAYLATESLGWKILLALSAACFMAAVWLGRTELKSQFSRKATRYGLNSALMSVIVFAIVVTINLIANNHDTKFDLTKNKLNTLSDQTVKVLKGLKEPVTLKVFGSPMQMAEFNELLDKYTYQSKLLKKEFVDVDRDPLLVRKYDVKQPGTIIVESATRTSKIENLQGAQDPRAEERLTNAIIQVGKGEKKKIYFVTGHGERMINDSSREGYSGMRDTLGAGRFNVEELNLVEKDKVPADAEIVILAGPRKDFMPHELKQLETYLQAGGKVFLMVEPDSSKALQPWLAKYGATWNPMRTVFERNPLQQLANNNPLMPIVNQYDRSHSITRDTAQMSIFKVATPVEKAATVPEGITVAPLLSTSRMSSEATISGNEISVNEKANRKGPLNLALAVSGKVASAPKAEKKPEGEEEKTPEYRMVVVGDSEFAANELRGSGMNSDLFQNMLSWLAQEEDLISIRPKATDESTFDITAQRMRIINLASIVFLPFAMFLSGIGVWLTRRRK